MAIINRVLIVDIKNESSNPTKVKSKQKQFVILFWANSAE